jgi:hypothetical protein
VNKSDCRKIEQFLLEESSKPKIGKNSFEFGLYSADSTIADGCYSTDSNTIYITDFQKRVVRHFTAKPEFKNIFLNAFKNGFKTQRMTIWIPESVQIVTVRRLLFSVGGFITPAKESCSDVKNIRNYDMFLPESCEPCDEILSQIKLLGVKTSNR